MHQKLNQISKKQKSLVQTKDDEDEPRDDFEGFGSITAMAQNKETLVNNEVQKIEEK